MKLSFPDKSYIEIKKSTTNGNIIVSIGASNNNSLTISSVEISPEEFKNLIKEVIEK